MITSGEDAPIDVYLVRAIGAPPCPVIILCRGYLCAQVHLYDFSRTEGQFVVVLDDQPTSFPDARVAFDTAIRLCRRAVMIEGGFSEPYEPGFIRLGAEDWRNIETALGEPLTRDENGCSPVDRLLVIRGPADRRRFWRAYLDRLYEIPIAKDDLASIPDDELPAFLARRPRLTLLSPIVNEDPGKSPGLNEAGGR